MLKGKEFGAAIGEAIQRKLDAGSALSKAEIARHFGMKPPSLSDWVKKGSVAKDKLPELWRYFSDVAGPEHWGLSESEWPAGLTSPPDLLPPLSAPALSMLPAPLDGPGAVAPSADFVPIRRVRLKVSAGVTGFAVDPLDGDGAPIFFRADWLAAKRWRADRLIALRVAGASMAPGLYDGDLVVINTDDTEPRDGEVFVINYEGEAVIKRLRRDGGLWWLASDNPDKRLYADKRCDEHALVLGRVIYKQSEHI